MPRYIPLNSRVLKFASQEKSVAHIGPDGLTDFQRVRGPSLGPRAILALVDRFYQKQIATGAVSEYVPRMRERVCVEGRDEVFVVICVDRQRAVVDLVSTERAGDLLESVAFSAIYPAEPPPAA